LSGDGGPEQVSAWKVTWTFWSVLGVQPMSGRVFTEDEDNKRVRVVVISHGLWQRRFGGSPGIIGRTIAVDDEPYQVIGVMPQRFYFVPSRDVDLRMPASFPAWMRTNFTWHDAQIVARFIETATAERPHELATVLQVGRVDLPVAPGEEIVGKRKRSRIFVLEHRHGLIGIPAMFRR